MFFPGVVCTQGVQRKLLALIHHVCVQLMHAVMKVPCTLSGALAFMLVKSTSMFNIRLSSVASEHMILYHAKEGCVSSVGEIVARLSLLLFA